jgi:hypothetical protein
MFRKTYVTASRFPSTKKTRLAAQLQVTMNYSQNYLSVRPQGDIDLPLQALD